MQSQIAALQNTVAQFNSKLIISEDQDALNRSFGTQYIHRGKKGNTTKRPKSIGYEKGEERLNEMDNNGELEGFVVDVLFPNNRNDHHRRGFAYRIGFVPPQVSIKIEMTNRLSRKGNYVKAKLPDYDDIEVKVGIQINKRDKFFGNVWLNALDEWTPEMQRKAGHKAPPPPERYNIPIEELPKYHLEVMKVIKSTS